MASTAQIRIPPTGSYTLDPARCAVAFTMRHLFGAGTVTGTFAVASGEVVIADSPADSSVRAQIRAATFETGNARRDKDVRSKRFLHTEKFPALSFRADRARRRDDGSWTLPGTLTVRGVEAPVDLTLTSATAAGGALTITAAGTVDRYAHGVTAFKGMAGRRLRIEISVGATRVHQPSTPAPTAARA
jgi:polyisoprenoid-binding protein YceI